MLSARLYLLVLALATLLFVSIIAAVNYIVDPFQMNGAFFIKGVNLEKPYAIRNARIAKSRRVQALEPVAIALGSSRADHGLDMNSSAWPDWASPRFNLGIPGAGVDEVRAYLVHAAESGKLRLAVIGLEFGMFNSQMTAMDFVKGFDSRVLDSESGGWSWPWMTRALAETYISTDTLATSYRTIRAQGRGRNEYDLTGRFTEPFYLRRARCNGGYRMVFKKVGHLSLTALKTSDGRKDLSFRYRDGSTSFEQFANLLRFARRHGIELRLFLSPGHLEERRIYQHQGYSEDVADWKRALVQILDDEALEAGAQAFPLWDFNYLDEVTDELVPAWGDTDSNMRWFWDHGHYKAALGERILKTVLSDPKATPDASQTFGMRLTADTLERERQMAGVWAQKSQTPSISLSEPGTDARSAQVSRPLDCDQD